MPIHVAKGPIQPFHQVTSSPSKRRTHKAQIHQTTIRRTGLEVWASSWVGSSHASPSFIIMKESIEVPNSASRTTNITSKVYQIIPQLSSVNFLRGAINCTQEPPFRVVARYSEVNNLSAMPHNIHPPKS
ncbi:hypothetical protein S245_062225 [Arachis hypogaea]